jgi:hypothetical protein
MRDGRNRRPARFSAGHLGSTVRKMAPDVAWLTDDTGGHTHDGSPRVVEHRCHNA